MRRTTDGSANGDIALADLLRIVSRRRRLLAGSTLAMMLLALGIGVNLPKSYTASTQLVLEPPAQGQPLKEQAQLQRTIDQETLATEIKVIESRLLAERVVDKLSLNEDQGFLVEQASVGSLRRWAAEHTVLERWLPPAATETTVEEPRQQAVRRVLDHLEVIRLAQSHVIEIRYSHRYPDMAALVANTLADVYIVDRLVARYERSQVAQDWLRGRMAELEAELDQAEQTINFVKRESGLVDGNASAARAAEIADINKQLIEEKVALTEKQATLDNMRRLNRQGAAEDIVELTASPMLQALRAEQASLIRRQAELQSQYGNRHPVIVGLNAERERIELRISAEVSRMINQFASEVEVAKTRASALEESLAALKDEAVNRTEIRSNLNDLERARANVQARYDNLAGLLHRTSQETDVGWRDVRIITPAAKPAAPEFPKLGVILPLGAALGLLLGLIATFFVEQLDDGFRSAREIEEVLGTRTLAMVPRLKGRGPKADPLDALIEDPGSAYSEAIRSALTQVLLVRNDRESPTQLVVTSALPAEGKTTFSAALARVAALEGVSTLLVEADLRRPALAQRFGLFGEFSAVDVLRDGVAPTQAIRKDPQSRLDVLPALQPVANPAGLLRSTALDGLMATAQNYELVIYDTPPLSVVPDASSLVHVADQVILVTQWEKTPQRVAADAFRQLQRLDAAITGVVIAQVDLKRHLRWGYKDQADAYARYANYYVTT